MQAVRPSLAVNVEVCLLYPLSAPPRLRQWDERS